MIEGHLIGQMQVTKTIMVTILKNKQGYWLEAGQYRGTKYVVLKSLKLKKWRKGDSR